ncbi:MAG: EAL domain-containing protein [Allosphingosinicella sp.]
MTDSRNANPLAGFLSAGPGGADEELSVVDRILDAVRAHLGMEIAFAARYFDGRRQFTHIRTDLPVPSAPGDSEPNDESFCHHILEGRLPELIHNALDIPFARTLPITEALPVGAHLDVPLRLKDGTVYGSFCCLSRSPDYSLTERDLGTMRAFAALAVDEIEREMRDGAAREAGLARIRGVLGGESLSMVFQPIHRLDTGAAVGVEALARFAGGDGRTPDLWFTEAESLGLGAELEMLAVRQAVRALPYIPDDLYLAVNVSPATVTSGLLEEALAASADGRLVVEVTEHSNVADHRELCRALDRLRGRVRIAIDDVGAGYSGLRRILDLKPDILKLDMSLTRDVDADPARSALAEAMVGFAAGLGCAIVAEGIETAGEAAALSRLGVGYGQGYHLSRPMPAVAAQQFLLGAGGSGDAPAAKAAPAQAVRRRA